MRVLSKAQEISRLMPEATKSINKKEFANQVAGILAAPYQPYDGGIDPFQEIELLRQLSAQKIITPNDLNVQTQILRSMPGGGADAPQSMQSNQTPPSAPAQNIYVTNQPSGNGLGVAALVLGIIAIIGAWIPLLNIVSLIFAIIAICLGIPALIIGIAKGRPKGSAIAGLALGIISVVVFSASYVALDTYLNEETKPLIDQTNGDSYSYAPENDSANEEAPDVLISDGEYSTDYAGNPVIIVNFEWTNTTDKTTSLIWTYNIKAYQNGVELDESYFSEDWLTSKEGVSASWTDSSKDVKPGATIQTSIAYEIADEAAPIEIEVSTFWDVDKVVTKKVFSIAPIE
ncbi:MAG: DUF5067 domain-containing protein [Clostridiales Family XIII bacterium]|nr:DUF5067 domain-containing protein [Clostridiales Family XIII bacterium]